MKFDSLVNQRLTNSLKEAIDASVDPELTGIMDQAYAQYERGGRGGATVTQQGKTFEQWLGSNPIGQHYLEQIVAKVQGSKGSYDASQPVVNASVVSQPPLVNFGESESKFQFNNIVEQLSESLSEQPLFVHERTGYNQVMRIRNAILVNDDIMELKLENGETIPMSIRGPNHNFKILANDGTLTDAMNVARVFGLLQPTCVVNEAKVDEKKKKRKIGKPTFGKKKGFIRHPKIKMTYEGTSFYHKDYNLIDHYVSLIMNHMFGKCLGCWSASHPAYPGWDKWVRKNYDKLRKMSDKEIMRHFKMPSESVVREQDAGGDIGAGVMSGDATPSGTGAGAPVGPHGFCQHDGFYAYGYPPLVSLMKRTPSKKKHKRKRVDVPHQFLKPTNKKPGGK